jgi:hypothetical protein
MATSNSTRLKARPIPTKSKALPKPKITDQSGHKLPKEVYRKFLTKFDDLRRERPWMNGMQLQADALKDALYSYTPSHQTDKWLAGNLHFHRACQHLWEGKAALTSPIVEPRSRVYASRPGRSLAAEYGTVQTGAACSKCSSPIAGAITAP